MRKCLILVACIVLNFTSYAAETFQFLLVNGHSEELVDYLETAGIEITRAAPFARVENSDELVKHLGEFAQIQQDRIIEARDSFWNVANSASSGDGAYQRNYYELRDAKIRHQLALQALESCVPEIAAVEFSQAGKAN